MTLKKTLAVVVGCAALVAVAVVPAVSLAQHRAHHRSLRSHRRHSRTSTRRALALTSSTNCSGVQSTPVPGDLNVPKGKTCTILAGVTVGHDVIVNSGATLIDQGAKIGNDLQATSPKGIGIGAPAASPGSVGHDIQVTGITGAGPGTGGSNYICNTDVATDVQITGSSSGAGQWIIGDKDEGCSTGADQIGNDLQVTSNKNRIDISDNMFGVPPYEVGIGDDLQVTGNTVTSTSPVVESNFIGNTAQCQTGTKKDADGTPNVVGVSNQGCP